MDNMMRKEPTPEERQNLADGIQLRKDAQAMHDAKMAAMPVKMSETDLRQMMDRIDEAFVTGADVGVTGKGKTFQLSAHGITATGATAHAIMEAWAAAARTAIRTGEAA